MLSVRLICVGKLKEKFYREACAEYEKRLKGYCKLEIIELTEQRLPERPAQAQIDAALAKEAEAVRAKIPAGSAVIANWTEPVVYTEYKSKCCNTPFTGLPLEGKVHGIVVGTDWIRN